MADKKLTLLELNLGDGTVQIGPATLGGDDGGLELDDDDLDDDLDLDLGLDLDDDGEDESGGGASCPGRKAGKLLLVLGVLGVLALLVKKLLGGGEYEDLDELEDLAELDEE
mgnify:CR=1 FL=1